MPRNKATKENISSFTIRIPEKLKENCVIAANDKNITLNEWIKRALSNAVEEQNDYLYQLTLPQIDKYTSYPNIFNAKNRREFIVGVSMHELHGSPCPECGGNVPFGDTYCRTCGKCQIWESPLKPYAVLYFEEFLKQHKTPWNAQYSLAAPDEMNPNIPYSIWLIKDDGDYRIPLRFIKDLSNEDIEIGKKIYNNLSDEEKEKMHKIIKSPLTYREDYSLSKESYLKLISPNK